MDNRALGERVALVRVQVDTNHTDTVDPLVIDGEVVVFAVGGNDISIVIHSTDVVERRHVGRRRDGAGFVGEVVLPVDNRALGERVAQLVVQVNPNQSNSVNPKVFVVEVVVISTDRHRVAVVSHTTDVIERRHVGRRREGAIFVGEVVLPVNDCSDRQVVVLIDVQVDTNHTDTVDPLVVDGEVVVRTVGRHTVAVVGHTTDVVERRHVGRRRDGAVGDRDHLVVVDSSDHVLGRVIGPPKNTTGEQRSCRGGVVVQIHLIRTTGCGSVVKLVQVERVGGDRSHQALFPDVTTGIAVDDDPQSQLVSRLCHSHSDRGLNFFRLRGACLLRSRRCVGLHGGVCCFGDFGIGRHFISDDVVGDNFGIGRCLFDSGFFSDGSRGIGNRHGGGIGGFAGAGRQSSQNCNSREGGHRNECGNHSGLDGTRCLGPHHAVSLLLSVIAL